MFARSLARAQSIFSVLVPIALASGCGGGRVDPEFTGPIEALPDARPSPRKSAAVPPRAFTRPKLVEIRADWCRFCRVAQPGIDAAYDSFQTKVDLVVLDVTNESTAQESERVAAEEGVTGFFADYRGRTPTVAVFVAPEQGRVVHGSLEEPEVLSRELAFAVAQFDERR